MLYLKNALQEALMVRAHCVTAAVAVCLFACGSVSGDGLLRRVAPDRAWVTFHCSEKWTDGTERAFYFTIKSVGRTTSDSQPARWIELKFESDGEKGRSPGTMFKFQVLEKHLAAGGDPLHNVLKAWRQRPDEKPTELNDLNFYLPRLNLFISPPIENLKKTDQRRTVDWQGGQLTCDVWEGSRRFEQEDGNDETRYLLSVHESIPFGVAAARLDVEMDDGVTGTVDFRVTDFGADATSDLSE
jgi:hypothetical protein